MVAGGAEFWTQATEGKTSDEIVDILLAEIQDGGSGRAHGQMDYFEGMVSADVCWSKLFDVYMCEEKVYRYKYFIDNILQSLALT